MTIRYMDLGGGKRLNDIVMVGTHDAGITSGDKNVQTQNLDIAGQAAVGVRFFDIRVAAKTVTNNGVKELQMRTFHADGAFVKNSSKHRVVDQAVGGTGLSQKVTHTHLRAGDWGETLQDVLTQARDFVSAPDTNSEFLILKFDKCTNWTLIADACIHILGAHMYTDGGNVNRKTLNDLAGKVVVLFSPKGKAEHQAMHGVPHPGILTFANLAKGDSSSPNAGYQQVYGGLQYYGNFGATAMKTTRSKKLTTNTKKQVQNMSDASLIPPDVIRMMYWTTTGLRESIQNRDKEMWLPPNLRGFLEAWDAGMGVGVSAHSPLGFGGAAVMGAVQIKRYMPNIIMIDFAHISKSVLIYNLNKVAAGEISSQESLMGMLVERLG